jgi:hypothetical protein
MDCNIIKDLIPLYIDGCCSEESKKTVKEHIENCDECKQLLKDMDTPSDVITISAPSKKFAKLGEWKASVLQSVLLFLSFGIITVGVALEAYNHGFLNGYWAFNIVIPATGFMLSLVNWYFVRLYKNRKTFSNCSLFATIGATLIALVYTCIHYEVDLFDLFALFGAIDFADFLEALYALWYLGIIGILLTTIFCALSKILSNQYAKMLGKE